MILFFVVTHATMMAAGFLAILLGMIDRLPGGKR